MLRQDEIKDAPQELDMAKELKEWVVKKIGAIARPRQILVVSELPKTRSGKIMRRLLRDVADGRAIGDVTTLADSSVMNSIKDMMEHSAD